MSFDADHTGYTRASNRPQPYDVIGTFDRLRKRAGKVDKPKKVGYTFGPAPAGGKPAKTVTASYPGARVGAQWSAKGKRWLISMDGVQSRAAEGGRLGPTTFVVQFATVRPSPYHDVNGANTPRDRHDRQGQGADLPRRQGLQGRLVAAEGRRPDDVHDRRPAGGARARGRILGGAHRPGRPRQHRLTSATTGSG